MDTRVIVQYVGLGVFFTVGTWREGNKITWPRQEINLIQTPFLKMKKLCGSEWKSTQNTTR